MEHSPRNPKPKRVVLLLSAPSGTGKTTIIRDLLEAVPGLRKIVTTTSRAPRPGEVSGVDYNFVSREEFAAMDRRGELIEWKEHFGQFYGLSWAEFAKKNDRDAIFDMDVFGKDELLSQVEERLVTIFLAPPSIEAIEARIRGRGDYTEDELRGRVGRALEEMERADTYDFVVVNRDRHETVREVASIMEQARGESPAGPRYICVEGLIGAGKTTLVQILGPRLGAKLYLDPHEDNPFLKEFYFSKRSMAFETELSFALLRSRHMQQIRRDLGMNRLILSDFTMAHSRVFAATNLNEPALGLFNNVYEMLLEDLPSPDLLIWIDAPYDLLLQRIKTRGRADEVLGVDESYLRSLHAQYKEVILDTPGVEVVTVTAERLDLLQHSGELQALVTKIGGD